MTTSIATDITTQNHNISNSSASSESIGIQLSPIEKTILEGEIVEALRTIYDPEIPINIYDLGLIYGIDIHTDSTVDVRMTLTSPGCPVAGTLPPEVEEKVASVPGVADAHVELVWDPPYNMDMMTDEAKLDLGLF